MSIILGIDPGSRCTGFGVIKTDGSRHHYITSGSIQTTDKDMSIRCFEIYSSICEIIKSYQPDQAGVEQVFVSHNPNSALKLGQARGAALVAIASHNIPVSEYTPRNVKQAIVGYGGADKSQIQHMVKMLLNLSDIPQVDAADALAIALCHSHSRKMAF